MGSRRGQVRLQFSTGAPRIEKHDLCELYTENLTGMIAQTNSQNKVMGERELPKGAFVLVCPSDIFPNGPLRSPHYSIPKDRIQRAVPSTLQGPNTWVPEKKGGQLYATPH